MSVYSVWVPALVCKVCNDVVNRRCGRSGLKTLLERSTCLRFCLLLPDTHGTKGAPSRESRLGLKFDVLSEKRVPTGE